MQMRPRKMNKFQQRRVNAAKRPCLEVINPCAALLVFHAPRVVCDRERAVTLRNGSSLSVSEEAWCSPTGGCGKAHIERSTCRAAEHARSWSTTSAKIPSRGMRSQSAFRGHHQELRCRKSCSGGGRFWQGSVGALVPTAVDNDVIKCEPRKVQAQLHRKAPASSQGPGHRGAPR